METSGSGGGGGGCIWIETGLLKLEGLLTADGADCTGNGGGGSGGGILLNAQRYHVTATADIRANGGVGGSEHGGGGGGGRIALWLGVSNASYVRLFGDTQSVPGLVVSEDPFTNFAVAPSVAGNTGINPGTSGTVRFVDGRPHGTLFILR